jgi:hypothetical protein
VAAFDTAVRSRMSYAPTIRAYAPKAEATAKSDAA